MDTRQLSLGVVSFALLAGAGAWAFSQPGLSPRSADDSRAERDEEGGDEEVITLDAAPAAVRAAAIKLAGDAKRITKVIAEEDEEDVTTYEVEYVEGEIQCAAIFSTAGVLMETEKATTQDKLPAAVLAALKHDYPEATFADPQAVTRMFYEIDVVIDGRTHEVKVDAAGNIEDEADGAEKHDEHAKGKRHEDDEEDDDDD